MILGMTGTSSGMTFRQARTFKKLLTILSHSLTEFHHGDCVGADDESVTIVYNHYRHHILPEIHSHPCTIAHMRAHNPYSVVIHPVLPPLDRNRVIVDRVTHMVGFPATFQETQRGGTWYTIRYSKKQRTPLTIIMPDGTVDVYPKKNKAVAIQ